MRDLTDEQKKGADELLTNLRLSCVLYGGGSGLHPDTVAQCLFFVAGEIGQNFNDSVEMQEEYQGKDLLEVMKLMAPEYIQKGADNFKKYQEQTADEPPTV